METIHHPEKILGPTEGAVGVILKELEKIAKSPEAYKQASYNKQLNFLIDTANPRVKTAPWETKLKIRDQILSFLAGYEGKLPEYVTEALTQTIALASYKDYSG